MFENYSSVHNSTSLRKQVFVSYTIVDLPRGQECCNRFSGMTELGTNASRQCLLLELLRSKLRLQLRVSTLALTFVGSHRGLLRCLQTAVVEDISLN